MRLLFSFTINILTDFLFGCKPDGSWRQWRFPFFVWPDYWISINVLFRYIAYNILYSFEDSEESTHPAEGFLIHGNEISSYKLKKVLKFRTF